MSLPAVSIRPARAEDAHIIFEWRNLPDIVALSEGQKTVAWDEHSAWYVNSLQNADRILLVITVDGEDSGLVRFDRNSDVASVGLYFVNGQCGKGYGKMVLPLAIKNMRGAWSIKSIMAHIRSDNVPSLKFFTAMGFIKSAENTDGMSTYSLSLETESA